MYTQPTFAVIAETTNGYLHDTLFATCEATLTHANFEWNQMTERERKCYRRYAIMKGYLDERDCFNIQLGEIIRIYQ